MKVRARILLTGKVQGVFLRYSTKIMAKKFGVNGCIRNLPNGRVECIYEGEKINVDELINYSKIGPSDAKISDIKVDWLNYEGEFKDFKIYY